MFINIIVLISSLGNSIFTFDGTVNTIIDLTTTLQCVQGNNPRSISFMIQTTYTGGSACVMGTGFGTTATGSAFGVTFSGSGGMNGVIGVDAYYVYNFPTTGKAINDGLWHSVLVIYDGTTVSIYVDGRLDNTATNWNIYSTATISSTLNTVGNSGNYLGQWIDGGYRWIGKLKNVLFYDYVITNTYALANNYQSAGNILYNSGNGNNYLKY